MDHVSKSPLRYFQRYGRGRRGGRDYAAMGREDPFRNGQVSFRPRIGAKLSTVERMISKPCPMRERLRGFY